MFQQTSPATPSTSSVGAAVLPLRDRLLEGRRPGGLLVVCPCPAGRVLQRCNGNDEMRRCSYHATTSRLVAVVIVEPGTYTPHHRLGVGTDWAGALGA